MNYRPEGCGSGLGEMSQGRNLLIRGVGAYLGVSHERVTHIYAEGKLPEPQRVDGIGPLWKPATVERWASVSGDTSRPSSLVTSQVR